MTVQTSVAWLSWKPRLTLVCSLFRPKLTSLTEQLQEPVALCDVKKDIAAVTFEVEQEGMGEQVGDLHILFCKLSGSIFANIYLQKWPFLQSRKLNMSIVQPYDDISLGFSLFFSFFTKFMNKFKFYVLNKKYNNTDSTNSL